MSRLPQEGQSAARMRRRLREGHVIQAALERSMPDPLTPEAEAAMRRRAKRCPMPGCGVKLSDKPFKPNSKELDHIVPRVLGGAHTIGNTRIICRLCNARRPDDGSDVGQLALTATVDPAAMALALKPRVQPAKPQRKPRTCEDCGAPAQKSGPRAWCANCHADRGRRAAALRDAGWKWQDIADALGLSGTGAAHNLAGRYAPERQVRRYGGRYWPVAA